MIWSKKQKKEVVPAVPAKALFVSDYLPESRILVCPPDGKKAQVIEKLVALLSFPDKPKALQAVLERESSGSTLVAPGVSFPHARMEGLNGIEAALALCPLGLDGAAAPEVCLLFLGPKANMKLHLDFLASASSLFQTEGFLPLLLQQASPAGVVEKIREAEKGR